MVPPAPGRFSTTMVAPICLATWSMTTRAITSLALPAPSGTTTVMFLEGQSWADAAPDSNASAIPNASRRLLRLSMVALPRHVFPARAESIGQRRPANKLVGWIERWLRPRVAHGRACAKPIGGGARSNTADGYRAERQRDQSQCRGRAPPILQLPDLLLALVQ